MTSELIEQMLAEGERALKMLRHWPKIHDDGRPVAPAEIIAAAIIAGSERIALAIEAGHQDLDTPLTPIDVTEGD